MLKVTVNKMERRIRKNNNFRINEFVYKYKYFVINLIMVYGFEGVPWKLKTIWAFNELADHIT